MSSVSLPVSRPAGRALLIGNQSGNAEPLHVLNALGFQCAELEDPYAAMAELNRRPLVYWALVLGLGSMYREELQLIGAVKRRYPHVEIWLTQTEGRAAAMAEAMCLGADGLLLEDGFHRTAAPSTAAEAGAPPRSPAPPSVPLPTAPVRAVNGPPAPAMAIAEDYRDDEPETDSTNGEPILTAEELRALLQDPPMSSSVVDGI